MLMINNAKEKLKIALSHITMTLHADTCLQICG